MYVRARELGGRERQALCARVAAAALETEALRGELQALRAELGGLRDELRVTRDQLDWWPRPLTRLVQLMSRTCDRSFLDFSL